MTSLRDDGAIADLEEIRRLKYRYMRGIDTQDIALVAGCFAEDASVSFDDGKYAAEGKPAIAELVERILASSFFSTHVAVHPEIEIAADRATGIWKLQTIALRMDAEEQGQNAGYYYEEYVREAGAWLISRSTYKLTFRTSQGWGEQRAVSVETFAGRGA